MAEEKAVAKKAEQPPRPAIPVEHGRGIIINTMEDGYRFAKYAHSAGLVPKSLGSPEAVLVAMQCGMELGLNAMESLRNVYVIDGTPALSASLKMAKLRTSGLAGKIRVETSGSVENRDYTVTITTTRKDTGEEVRESYSMLQAKHLLNKSNWRNDPERMTRWRAAGALVDFWFPEVCKGIATKEVLEDLAPVERNITPPREEMRPTMRAGAKSEKPDPALEALGLEVVDEYVTTSPPEVEIEQETEPEDAENPFSPDGKWGDQDADEPLDLFGNPVSGKD